MSTRPVKLLSGDRARCIDAVLENDLPWEVLVELEQQWGNLRREANAKLEREGRGDECQHGHWSWDREGKVQGVREGNYRLIGVRVGSEWQGALSIYREPTPAFGLPWWRKALSRVGMGSHPRVLYVDYLEGAPWNFQPFVRPNIPRFVGVGGLLLDEVVHLSFEMGLGGRMGLFSLSTSEQTYVRFGMVKLFEDHNPRSSTRGCWYYELTTTAAERRRDREAR